MLLVHMKYKDGAYAYTLGTPRGVLKEYSAQNLSNALVVSLSTEGVVRMDLHSYNWIQMVTCFHKGGKYPKRCLG